MKFSPQAHPDPTCLTGNGDITEVTAEVCRTIATTSFDLDEGVEAACLFPFTLDGVTYNECITDQKDSFTQPVFRCPIRRVKGAGPSGTDYRREDLTFGGFSNGGYCPTNSIGINFINIRDIQYRWNEDGPVRTDGEELELDRKNILCKTTLLDLRRPVFSTCKNNCPGGKSYHFIFSYIYYLHYINCKIIYMR